MCRKWIDAKDACIEEKKGREKEEKKRRKGGKNRESNCKNQKTPLPKKNKKQVHPQVFTHFWDQSEIRYFRKSNLCLLSFSWKILSMSELDDIQGLMFTPDPIFATVPKFSGSPKDMV